MIFGKLLRTSLVAFGALAVASVTQASAADVYTGGGYKDVPVAAPCCSFAGFYVGGNMGMAWSEIEHRGGEFDDFHKWYGEVKGHAEFFNGDKFHSVGGFGGGQLGYNWQNSCCVVYGIEADLGALALNNRFHRFMPVNDWMVNGVSIDGRNGDDNAFFAGDVTARLGYAVGTWMAYVKGGFAFVDANNNNVSETIFWRHSPTGNMVDTFRNGDEGNNWLTGWTVGAGLEWKPCCQSNWSIKVEYLHYDFSGNDQNCCNDIIMQKFPNLNNNNIFRNKNDVTADTIKVGFNYFWSPTPVVAPLK